MIVDFTVENFRSIKKEQLFSLYVDKKNNHHAGNISYAEDEIGLLKSVAVYGANASGKTNLLLAVQTLKKLIVESGDWKDGDSIDCYEPYLLSGETINKPTKFEIEFYVGKERYRYHIEYNLKEILFEKLDQYKTSKPSNIFTRAAPDDWKLVKFGDSYKGGKKQFAFFPNNAYLSKAGNSPESPDFMREIYNFFRRKINVLGADNNIDVLDWEKKPGLSEVINSFLSKADFGISGFSFEKGELPDGFSFPPAMPESIRSRIAEQLTKKAVFKHRNDAGDEVVFDIAKESRGTKKIFKLIPFFTMVLISGEAVFIDEIESSLHPHIAELVIKLFNDPLVNTKNAQLIFTTHDMSLMSQSIFRKDQVYLCAKSTADGSEFVSLDDYDSSLKDSSPFAKWYNEGRLGGIPEINYRDIADSIIGAINHAQA